MTSTGSCHDVALCWLPVLPVLLCVDCLTCFWTRSWLDLTCFWRSRGQFGQWVILARILRFCQGWSSNCLLNYLAHSIVFYTVCHHLFALAGGISVNSDTGALLVSEMRNVKIQIPQWQYRDHLVGQSTIIPSPEFLQKVRIVLVQNLDIYLTSGNYTSLYTVDPWGLLGPLAMYDCRHHINLVIGPSNYWCSPNCPNEEENIVTF